MSQIPTPEQITPEMEAAAEAFDDGMQRLFKGIITRKERRKKMIRATLRQAASEEA